MVAREIVHLGGAEADEFAFDHRVVLQIKRPTVVVGLLLDRCVLVRSNVEQAGGGAALPRSANYPSIVRWLRARAAPV
jgi:hypothetical protein